MSLGDPCESNAECYVRYGYCLDGECQCPEEWYLSILDDGVEKCSPGPPEPAGPWYVAMIVGLVLFLAVITTVAVYAVRRNRSPKLKQLGL